jgi:uncharacterized repeat protein (TIGR03803 family)
VTEGQLWLSLLYTFTGTNNDGVSPNGLVSGSNTLYGTTQYGGTSSPGGTVFALHTNGMGFTTLYNFSSGTDGYNVNSGLILSGNTLFGTTQYGGTSGDGTVFAINVDGAAFTNLHSFSSGDAAFPFAGLILSDHTLYGTGSAGGGSSHPDGAVFAVNTDGTGFTNLHGFSGTDGASPFASVILVGDSLYGTTSDSGTSGSGTVFALNTNGTGFRTLYRFTAIPPYPSPSTNEDGYSPQAGLVSGDKTLYGTTSGGGIAGFGTVFSLNTNGTGFQVLHSFTGGSEGASPSRILCGNTLYGTTLGDIVGGGTTERGTVFAINIDGTGFHTLYTFAELPPFPGPYTNSDGGNPKSLILSGNTLYGTTLYGGSSGYGTVFSISLPVSPPQLTIAPAGENVVLTWPTNFTNFSLQSTTNLLSPAAWGPISQTPVIVNGLNTVTDAISGSSQFYRLSQ